MKTSSLLAAVASAITLWGIAGCGGKVVVEVGDAGSAALHGSSSSGSAACVPRTCQDLGIDAANPSPGQGGCGKALDGCGGAIWCGWCPGELVGDGTGQFCGDGDCSFKRNVCYYGGSSECPCEDCRYFGRNCGQSPAAAPNSCGGSSIDCGTCTAPQTCGGGGKPGVCGPGPCIPVTCAQKGFNCGSMWDGCSADNTDCGTCPEPERCGGNGTPHVCEVCIPLTCKQLGFSCGVQSDSCDDGVKLDCGTCTPPQTCGGVNGQIGKHGVCSP